MTSTSYIPALVGFGGMAEEVERLEQQAELTFFAEVALLSRSGIAINEDLRVLDLGCGTGAFTRRLRQHWPMAQVEGVDVDPELVGYLEPPSRVVARSGALGAPASYDLVVVRYVAQHLQQVERRDLWRRAGEVLRPGGVLAVIDVDEGDWGTTTPHFPALERVYRKVARLQAVRGGSRDLLPSVQAELVRPVAGSPEFVEAQRLRGQVTSDEVPLDRFEVHLGPRRHIGHLVDGGLDLADLALVGAAWKAFRSAPDAYAALNVHLVHARTSERSSR